MAKLLLSAVDSTDQCNTLYKHFSWRLILQDLSKPNAPQNNLLMCLSLHVLFARDDKRSIAVKANINPPPKFTTQRLTLRAPVVEDAPALFKSYASKPHIPKYMSWVAHSNVSQTTDFLMHCILGWNTKSNFEYVIEITNVSKGPIGMISIHPLTNGVGFGYVIAEEYWNQGITSEALIKLLDWSLSQDGVFRAQAFCDVENPASARVMEKAGMSYEGILRRHFVHPNLSNEPRDSLMYAKIR